MSITRRKLLAMLPLAGFAVPAVSELLPKDSNPVVHEMKPQHHYFIRMNGHWSVSQMVSAQKKLDQIYAGTGIHVVVANMDCDIFDLG